MMASQAAEVPVEQDAYVDAQCGDHESCSSSSRVTVLLDLPLHLLEFIMLEQDGRGQAMSNTLCRTMGFDIGRDPFYRTQLVAKLAAPTIEPSYSVVYLPRTTHHGQLPRAWDPAHCGGTWRALPPLDFLPAGEIRSVRAQGCSAAQAGLLFFHLDRDDVRRRNPAAPMRKRERLCVCNPLTRTAVLVTPRQRVDFAGIDPAIGHWMRRQDHMYTVLHARPGAGFTLYELGQAPKMLRKLHHGPAAAVVGMNIVESSAKWETVVRQQPEGGAAAGHGAAANHDANLILCTKPVVLDKMGVIRSLCMRKVEPEGYEAVFVDYDMGKEEWAEDEQVVGGVPRGALGRPRYGDVEMVSLGDTGLWLLHNRLSIAEGAQPAASGTLALHRMPTSTATEVAVHQMTRHLLVLTKDDLEPNRGIDIYFYDQAAKAFVMVDSAWIPVSAALSHGGTSTSTTIAFSLQSTMGALLSYDVRTKEWSRGLQVQSVGAAAGDDLSSLELDYNEWPVANFQLSHAPVA